MLTFEELSQLPRKKRRAGIAEYLKYFSHENASESSIIEEVERITALGSRFRDCIYSLADSECLQSSRSVNSAIKKVVRNQTTRKIVLRGKRTGLGHKEVEYLLEELEECKVRRNKTHLIIDIKTKDAYVYGLSAIAAWACQHASDLEIEYSGESWRVKEFLKRTGYIKALREYNTDPVKFDTKKIMGFTRIPPINEKSKYATETQAKRLVKMFRDNTDISAASEETLSIAFAELIENCIKHGKIESPAWLFANYHAQYKIMHVCICDRGVGIKQSFVDSADEELHSIASDKKKWIKHCTELYVTSKASDHAGYGLYLVRELCRRNRGRFVLRSGEATYRLKHRKTALEGKWIRDEYVYCRKTGWQGTFLGLQLFLDRDLDIGSIYADMPPVRGYEGESVDLFD